MLHTFYDLCYQAVKKKILNDLCALPAHFWRTVARRFLKKFIAHTELWALKMEFSQKLLRDYMHSSIAFPFPNQMKGEIS